MPSVYKTTLKKKKSLKYVILKSVIQHMEIEFVKMQQQILVMAASGAELFLMAKVLPLS